MLMDLVGSGIFRMRNSHPRTRTSESSGENHHRFLGPTSRVSDSGILGQGLRTCIFKFSGDADDTSPGSTVREPLQ